MFVDGAVGLQGGQLGICTCNLMLMYLIKHRYYIDESKIILIHRCAFRGGPAPDRLLVVRYA